jgi:hypothetical protein
LDYSLISNEAGKGEGANFTGAFVGMCCQDMTGTNLPAEFSYLPTQKNTKRHNLLFCFKKLIKIRPSHLFDGLIFWGFTNIGVKCDNFCAFSILA